MVRIRLRRIGLKGQPTYRVVAADKESPRDGRFLEILGVYNPRTNPATVHLKEDRVYHWMKNGAQPTESVEQVFKSAGLLERFHHVIVEQARLVMHLREAAPAFRALHAAARAVLIGSRVAKGAGAVTEEKLKAPTGGIQYRGDLGT